MITKLSTNVFQLLADAPLASRGFVLAGLEKGEKNSPKPSQEFNQKKPKTKHRP